MTDLGYANTIKGHDVTHAILDGLVEGSLPDNLETVCTAGGAIGRCRWRNWAVIRNNPPADALRRRMQLEASDFLAHP